MHLNDVVANGEATVETIVVEVAIGIRRGGGPSSSRVPYGPATTNVHGSASCIGRLRKATARTRAADGKVVALSVNAHSVPPVPNSIVPGAAKEVGGVSNGSTTGTLGSARKP